MIPQPAPWACARCGADFDSACERLTPACDITPELVIHRLEQAGATLLAMREVSPYPAPYRCALPDVLREFWECYGRVTAGDNDNASSPPPRAITAMDATYCWLSLIPNHRYVVRRIVGARSLVSPITGKHLFSWRALADRLGCDYRAAQTWHKQGIELITRSLSHSP